MSAKLNTIVIVNDFAHVNGGAATVAIASAKALAEKGYRVIFFAAVGPIASELMHPNITVHCLNQAEILKDRKRWRAVMQGLWNFKAASSLKTLLLQLNPSNTIVHLHGWTKALSSSVVRITVKLKFKLICTVHDYFLACPNGGFLNYQKNQVCTLKALSLACIFSNCDSRNYFHKLWRIQRQLMQKIFGGIPSALKNYIVISNLSEQIIKPYLPKNAHIFRIANPIFVVQAPPVKVENNHAFVYIGRLAREKGALLFAQTAAKLKVKVIFIGDGELRQQIQDILPDAVITGWLSTQQVVAYLNSARALVFPSLWYEGQPLVVFEALARGVPVIISDQCAAIECVENGRTGFWFKNGDGNDLIAKIVLLQNDEVVKNMGHNAYRTYWQNPNSIDVHLSALLCCYNTILSKH